MRLTRKVVIVTGAGSGIGHATALLFGREGAHVVAVDRDQESTAQATEGIRAAGGRAIGIPADVGSEKDARTVIERTIAEYGRIDVLFNNAGVSSFTSLLETDESEIDRVFGTNVKSVFFLSRATIPHMKRQGSGSIINSSSITGIVGAPGMAAPL